MTPDQPAPPPESSEPAKVNKKRARKKKKHKPPVIKQTVIMSAMERNVAMFRDWITGTTKTDLAIRYDVNINTVLKVSKENNWDALKKKAIDRMLGAAVQEVKGMAYMMTLALKRDMEIIIKQAVQENRTLSGAERDHFAKLLDRFMKEARLDDGKPTEISSDTKRVELVLPPGVKRFGIIPPDPRVHLVESKVEEKKQTIGLDDVELDLKDIK